MYCGKCGKEISDSALFCKSCGTKIQREGNNTEGEINSFNNESGEEDFVLGMSFHRIFVP